jgi:glutaminyl-tRNA synthetase
METPVKGFHRLTPGQEVRLRYAFIVKCTGVTRDERGEVVEVRCTYDSESHSGGPAAGRKVKGTIHWVSARHAVSAEVRLYDRLFTVPNPSGEEWKDFINPYSVEILNECRLERSLADALPEIRYQFERQGYYCVDEKDSLPEAPVFNRTATLRDSWARMGIAAKGA